MVLFTKDRTPLKVALFDPKVAQNVVTTVRDIFQNSPKAALLLKEKLFSRPLQMAQVYK